MGRGRETQRQGQRQRTPTYKLPPEQVLMQPPPISALMLEFTPFRQSGKCSLCGTYHGGPRTTELNLNDCLGHTFGEEAWRYWTHRLFTQRVPSLGRPSPLALRQLLCPAVRAAVVLTARGTTSQPRAQVDFVLAAYGISMHGAYGGPGSVPGSAGTNRRVHGGVSSVYAGSASCCCYDRASVASDNTD